MIDNCAGASVFPVGYDDRAEVDDTVPGVTLTPATGEPVPAYAGRKSRFRLLDGQEFTVTYNEAKGVKHPIVSVAESTVHGNWYVLARTPGAW